MSKKKQSPIVKFTVAFEIPLDKMDAMAGKIAMKSKLEWMGFVTVSDEDNIVWKVCRAGAAAARKGKA